MIIPVRCMACGKVLADKWEAYSKRCGDAGIDAGGDNGNGDDRMASPQQKQEQKEKRKLERSGDASGGEKTDRGIILDELGIVTICCRIAMQTHVDMSLII